MSVFSSVQVRLVILSPGSPNSFHLSDIWSWNPGVSGSGDQWRRQVRDHLHLVDQDHCAHW